MRNDLRAQIREYLFLMEGVCLGVGLSALGYAYLTPTVGYVALGAAVVFFIFARAIR